MVWFYIVLPVLLLLVLAVIDIVRVFLIKTIPDLPDEPWDFSGVSRLYFYLSEGAPEGVILDETYILRSIKTEIDYIDARYDCADFRIPLLFCLYKDFYEQIGDSARREIKKALLGFKYWMTEPGCDSMCFWSENHQCVFAAAEYLAGQEWQDEIFVNDGKTGSEHRTYAAYHLKHWIDQRLKYGFSEWYSNNYYVEDIAPMSILLEYCQDRALTEGLRKVMDLLWFDVATHCVNGTFVAVSSRMYSDNKSSDLYGNGLAECMRALFETPLSYAEELAKLEQHARAHNNGHTLTHTFMAAVRKGVYRLPQVIEAIAKDPAPVVVKSSSGLDPEEMIAEGLIGEREEQIMFQMGAESFTNPGLLKNSYRYLKKNKMFSNKPIAFFRILDLWLVRKTGLAYRVAKKCELMTHGVALKRGNVYFYRNGCYSLATAAACGVDANGAQGHIWTANLAQDVVVYTIHAVKEGNTYHDCIDSPGYWIGNGRQPMSVQEENVNLTIYKIPDKKRLLEFTLTDITHLYFPKERFDETRITAQAVFGRKGNVFVAVRTGGTLSFAPYNKESALAIVQHEKKGEKRYDLILKEEFDLVQRGKGYHWYATELSDAARESFADFQERILGNDISFDNGKLTYCSGGKRLEVAYKGDFYNNGIKQDLQYKRFDSRYCVEERKPEQINISFGGKTYTIL